MKKPTPDRDPKGKLLGAAKELFALKGYRSSSIREIADKAGMNSALIQHYFGGKQGLLVEIARELMDGEFKLLLDILEGEPGNVEELRARLGLFLDHLILRSLGKWEALNIVMGEIYELSQIKSFSFPTTAYDSVKALARYLTQAQKQGILAEKVDVLIVADHLMSLAIDQVKNWKMNQETLGFDISDKKQRKHWLEQTLDIYLHGALARR